MANQPKSTRVCRSRTNVIISPFTADKVKSKLPVFLGKQNLYSFLSCLVFFTDFRLVVQFHFGRINDVTSGSTRKLWASCF